MKHDLIKKTLIAVLALTLILTSFAPALPVFAEDGDDGTELTAITADQVILDRTTFTYDGNIHKPAVSIEGLTKDVDYTVSYESGRKNVGTYDVTVTGKGNYTGTVTKSFRIVKKAQKVTVKKTSWSKKISSDPFSIGAKSNGPGTLKYKSSNKNVAKVSSSGKVTIRGAGTTKITVYAASTKNYKKSPVRTVTVKVATPSTTSSYKKYIAKWKTVDYTLTIKVMTKNYVKATLKSKQGDYVVINRKMDVSKLQKLELKSHDGEDVSLKIRFKYGKPYTEYGGARVVDGPELHISGSSGEWCRNDYKIKKNGKWVDAYTVYQKYL